MEKHYQMWEELGLDLERHDEFLEPLPGIYGDLFMGQENRPEAMEYYDFVVGDIHGIRVKELMAEKEQEAEWVIERKKIQPALPFPEDDQTWTKIDVWDLLKTFSHLISSISADNVIDLHEEITVNEKISLIHELLDTRGEFYFTDLITRPQVAMDIICSFLAILDSVKSRIIGIFQNKLFGDIKIRRLSPIPKEKEHETGT